MAVPNRKPMLLTIQEMIIFLPSFSALFFNHAINPAFFEIRLKTVFGYDALGAFEIALK